MAYVIFDLDETVIDSSHRKATLPCGSLDLDHWIENNIPEKILQDSLLPLAKAMRALYTAGNHIVVCTARIIQDADLAFLACNRLPYHAMLHRGMHADAFKVPDCKLKIDLLTDYFSARGYSSVKAAKPIMFDDNVKVINALTNIGVKVYNAIEINRRLAA